MSNSTRPGTLTGDGGAMAFRVGAELINVEMSGVLYPEECRHCSACVLDRPAEGAIRLRTPIL